MFWDGQTRDGWNMPQLVTMVADMAFGTTPNILPTFQHSHHFSLPAIPQPPPTQEECCLGQVLGFISPLLFLHLLPTHHLSTLAPPT